MSKDIIGELLVLFINLTQTVFLSYIKLFLTEINKTKVNFHHHHKNNLS